MRITSKVCFTAFSTLLLCLAAWPAVAQDGGGLAEVSLFGEEEFTIRAATKTEIPVSKAPSSVSVISAQQIKESGARHDS